MGRNFKHEKSGFDDDGIYEFLIGFTAPNDISRIDVCITFDHSWEDIVDYALLC